METYFEHKKALGGVSFCFSRNPVINEREIHPYHEILYYRGGGATFICDGFTKALSPRSLLLIPRESYHFFKLEDPKSFERLKISFTSIEGYDELLYHCFSSVRIFEDLGEIARTLLENLCTRLWENNKSGEREQAFALGSLLLLLSSLDPSSSDETENYRSQFVSRVLRYVEKKISSDINTASIAAELGVSASGLSHTFKSEMGISLHKYVTQKRIALAERLLSSGKSPTKIYSECGFGDYSSFYKAYFKLTGHAPTKGR